MMGLDEYPDEASQVGNLRRIRTAKGTKLPRRACDLTTPTVLVATPAGLVECTVTRTDYYERIMA